MNKYTYIESGDNPAQYYPAFRNRVMSAPPYTVTIMLKLRSLLVASVAVLAFGSVSRAQLLTVDNLTGFVAADGYTFGHALTAGEATTQSFSNITSIEALTFRFIATDSSSFGATSLQTYFSEWGGRNAASEIGSSGLIALSASTSWTNSGDGYLYFDATLDLSTLAVGLSPGTTYGLSIVGNSTTDSGGVFLAGGVSGYGDGSGYAHAGVSSFTDLQGGGADLSQDYAFSASSIAPVPEASTVAVLFAGVFVGGLVLMRLRQKRQQAAVVVAQA